MTSLRCVLCLAPSASRLLLRVTSLQANHQYASIQTTAVALASKKSPKRQKGHVKTTQKLDEDFDADRADELKASLDRALEEYRIKLVTHCSLRTDVRAFSELQVQLENGKQAPLSHVAQISRKSARLLQILVSNVSHVAAVKNAISNSTLNVNPQVEGTAISVPLVPVTKEHRQELANNSKRLFNEFKEQSNRIMGKLTSSMQRNYAGSTDEKVKEQQLLLSIRKAYEQKAKEMAEQRAKDLLTES